MERVTLRNDHLAVTLDPSRGGEVTSIRAGGHDALAYYDWAAPLAAGTGPAYGSSELDWLSRYRAGWQFLFPNAGAESAYNSVPVAFHGESSLAVVDVESVDATRCAIRTHARLPLELHRTITLSPDRPAVLVEETVTNVGAEATPFVWGHHPTFPAIPGGRIDLPAARFSVEPTATGDVGAPDGTWPLTRSHGGGILDLSEVPEDVMVRLLYLHDLSGHWAALRSPAGDATGAGIAMAWDAAAYPSLWLWLQNGDPGFPWYGRARMIGIEPQTAWPFDGLAGAIERGQAHWVGPGETISSWCTLVVLSDSRTAVTGVDRDGRISHD